MSSAATNSALLVKHADLVTTTEVHKGLKGVLVDNTAVCEIDDVNSLLRYRGYDITELIAQTSFEEIVYLLLWGELPTAGQRKDIEQQLEDGRRLPAEVVKIIQLLPRETTPMAALRTAISALGCFEGSLDLATPKLRAAAVRLTAQVPTILNTFMAHRRGHQPAEPLRGHRHSENVLHLLAGRAPDPDESRAMDGVLAIHADHEFNASCFSARVTVSTLSDLHSAITSGVGTLSGSLHGGANERVLELVEKLGTPEAVEPFIEQAIGRKEKISGFGQRGCRYEDPRALILRGMAEELASKTNNTKQFEMFIRLNEIMRKRTTLWPNVDFYSASVLNSLGVPTDIFTPVFVCSRIVGWSAHVIEQVESNVIIRPKGLYNGHAYRPIPDRRS